MAMVNSDTNYLGRLTAIAMMSHTAMHIECVGNVASEQSRQ